MEILLLITAILAQLYIWLSTTARFAASCVISSRFPISSPVVLVVLRGRELHLEKQPMSEHKRLRSYRMSLLTICSRS